MAQKSKSDVSTPSIEFQAMVPVWQMIADVYAGSEALRQHGSVYIPQHHSEPSEAYADRLDNLVAFNFLRQTVEELTGRTFSRDPVFDMSDDAAPWRDEFLPDVDHQKHAAPTFLRDWFACGLKFGCAHLLVEPGEDRPRWRIIDPRDLFFAALDENGDLSEIRYHSSVTAIDGFEEVKTPEIVRMTPDLIEVYREDKEWAVHSTEANTLGRIPLVPFFIEREGVLACESPLRDLAELQISHARKRSDLDTTLRVASFPMLAVQGGNYDESQLIVGPHALIELDPDSTAFYVEHTGAAVETLMKDLKALEERAATFGAQITTKRPSVETATGAVVNANSALAPLQGYALAFIEAVNEALALTQEIWGQDMRPAFSMSIDFLAPDSDAQSIIRLRELGDISRIDALSELKRRGALSSAFDIEVNEERLESEGPIAANGDFA